MSAPFSSQHLHLPHPALAKNIFFKLIASYNAKKRNSLETDLIKSAHLQIRLFHSKLFLRRFAGSAFGLPCSALSLPTSNKGQRGVLQSHTH